MDGVAARRRIIRVGMLAQGGLLHGHGHGFPRCAAVVDQTFRKSRVVHATTCGHVFAGVTQKDHCERCRVEEVTLCSRSDADRIRLVRCAVQQLACIQYGRINPIRGVVVVSMGEVLSAFVS